MRNPITILITFLLLLAFLSSCTAVKQENVKQVRPYLPADQELYDSIVEMDRVFFAAYNTCDLETQAATYTDDIEFYHDKGGLMTSKQAILDATEKNICGKVTRELMKGSVEVYPIEGYGAVQIGFHKFYNNQEPEAISKPSKFIVMWKKEGDDWKMAKVISLH